MEESNISVDLQNKMLIPINKSQLELLVNATRAYLKTDQFTPQTKEELETLVILLHGKLADLNYNEKFPVNIKNLQTKLPPSEETLIETETSTRECCAPFWAVQASLSCNLDVGDSPYCGWCRA